MEAEGERLATNVSLVGGSSSKLASVSQRSDSDNQPGIPCVRPQHMEAANSAELAPISPRLYGAVHSDSSPMQLTETDRRLSPQSKNQQHSLKHHQDSLTYHEHSLTQHHSSLTHHQHLFSHPHNTHHASTAPSKQWSPQEHINRRLFRSDHVSFLEEIAREECRNLPCKEHYCLANDGAPPEVDANNAVNSRAENDEDGLSLSEERRRFMLLDFSLDDEVSDSEEDSSSEDDGTDYRDSSHDEMSGEEEGSEIHGQVESNDPLAPQNESENASEADKSNGIVANASSFPSACKPNMGQVQFSNPTNQRISYLLLSLANSEEQPLIRADIPWPEIISCGCAMTNSTPQKIKNDPFFSLKPSLLQTLYQKMCDSDSHQIRDPNGARLLHGVLRMDPPLEAVKVILDAFPLSCQDMEGFFTACQFAHPNTSLRVRGGEYDLNNEIGANLIPDKKYVTLDDYCNSHDDTDDVGEVVKLVMHRTILARQLNGVDWGMVAFLGDARISPSHAKLLLRHAPEALIDPKHGAFGVSPLDRMASGFFIHGEKIAWVEKLRLGLRVAAFVRQKQLEQGGGVRSRISLPKGFFKSDSQLPRRRESSNVELPRTQESFPAEAFYPYHELIRLLVSPKFQGNKFGRHGFLHTLKACTESDPDAFLRPDNEGNLPIHTALQIECETSLGTKGERRLIKYLLALDRNTALSPEGSLGRGRNERRLPLRLSIENAWPVYDLIIDSAFIVCKERNGFPFIDGGKHDSSITRGDYVMAKTICDRPLLHIALGGPCHSRFGIHGARQLVKNIISRMAHYHNQHPNNVGAIDSHHCLTNFVDAEGRTALHLALESKFPVHDLILQAKPNLIEARDPTQYGFFPFQTAACAFTACCHFDIDEEMAGAIGLKDKGKDLHQSSMTATSKDKKEAMEMSILFELIRECPLCVTWKVPGDITSSKDAHSGGLRQVAMDDGPFLGQTKKRRRPS